MKKYIILFNIVIVLFAISFSGCNKDETAPKIKLKNYNGKPINPVAEYAGVFTFDTTILMFTKYEDPGIFVEDNATETDKITVTVEYLGTVFNNYAKNNGYVKRAGTDGVVKYTATDEAGNSSTISRKVRVANPSEILCSYDMNTNKSDASFKLISRTGSSNYDQSCIGTIVKFTVSNTIPGAIAIDKVFAHKEGQDTETIYSYKIIAHLFSGSQELSSTFSEIVGYLGKPSEYNTVFYDGLMSSITPTTQITYNEVLDMLSQSNSTKKIDFLRISTQEVSKNNASSEKATFDMNGNCTLTRLPGSTEINKITLNYRINYKYLSGGVLTPVIENITEVYEKRYTDE